MDNFLKISGNNGPLEILNSEGVITNMEWFKKRRSRMAKNK